MNQRPHSSPLKRLSGTSEQRKAAEQPVVITGIMPGLHIRMAMSPPVADWLCRCGHHERAVGRAAVIELTTRVRVWHCPHAADEQKAPATEGGEVAARKGVRSVTDLHLPATAATTPAVRRNAA